MNAFERYSSAEPSAQEFIERDEEAARFAERRSRALDNAWEYARENWVEATEFKPKPASHAHQQDELDFGEVA